MPRRRTCCVARKCRSRNTARWRRGWWRAALRCWCRNDRAMARPADAISKTRAAATKPTIHARAAPRRMRSRRRWLSARAILHPAGRRRHCRALGRRLGRAGAGARKPADVSAIIAFAAGRGGHANDFPNQVCAPHTLMSAAAEFGKGARVPVTWLVAANDSYFSPACRGSSPTRFAPAATRSTFACCRRPAARVTGWRKPRPA